MGAFAKHGLGNLIWIYRTGTAVADRDGFHTSPAGIDRRVARYPVVY